MRPHAHLELIPEFHTPPRSHRYICNEAGKIITWTLHVPSSRAYCSLRSGIISLVNWHILAYLVSSFGWKQQDKFPTPCQCVRCTHDLIEERLSEVRTQYLYSASQSYLHAVCPCRETAVEFCTELSLIMPPLAFHSCFSFTSPFTLLISCDAFHSQNTPRLRCSRK